jgi:hypothetical protein
MVDIRIACNFFLENLKGREDFEDLDGEGRVILKRI